MSSTDPTSDAAMDPANTSPVTEEALILSTTSDLQLKPTAVREAPQTSIPPIQDVVHLNQDVKIPMADITMPIARPFQPALIPHAARPLVRALIKLVGHFVSMFMWISLAVLTVVGVIMCTFPANLHFFGMLVQGVLTVACLVLFVSVLFAVNVKRVDIAYQLKRLQELCDGDEAAAKPLALDVASDASGATLGTALAMMDGIQNMHARAVAGAASKAVTDADAATADGAASVADAAAGTRGNHDKAAGHDNAHEGTHLLLKPPGPFKDKPEDYSAAAAEGTIAAVRTNMEEDSMYIFERMIPIVMHSMLSNVISMPFLCFFAGCVMCQLGAPFSGSELILAGFLTAVTGPMVWASVQAQDKQLDAAKTTVTHLNLAAEEEQKVKELEKQQRRAHEVELQGQKELVLVVEKEKELELLKAATKVSKKQGKEQPNFFGIPLPKFEFNPFQQSGGAADHSKESGPKNDDIV